MFELDVGVVVILELAMRLAVERRPLLSFCTRLSATCVSVATKTRSSVPQCHARRQACGYGCALRSAHLRANCAERRPDRCPPMDRPTTDVAQNGRTFREGQASAFEDKLAGINISKLIFPGGANEIYELRLTLEGVLADVALMSHFPTTLNGTFARNGTFDLWSFIVNQDDDVNRFLVRGVTDVGHSAVEISSCNDQRGYELRDRRSSIRGHLRA